MESPPELLPSRPRQFSKVPGGFDTEDELSPIKASFDHVDGNAHQREPPASRGLAAFDTPRDARRVDDGFSQLEDDRSMVDEKEMKRKLMDVESSFLPELSPHPGSVGSTEEAGSTNDQALPSPLTPPGSYQTPAPMRDADLPESSDRETPYADHANTSSLETMSSSPTAAAAARTVSRVVSMASAGGYEAPTEDSSAQSLEEHADEIDDSQEQTPRKALPNLRSQSQEASQPPTETPPGEHTEQAFGLDDHDNGQNGSRNQKKRPQFLVSRHSSQRWSTISHTTTSTEGGSDLTVGAEYALQTGGGAPLGSSTSSRPQTDLSRSISLGSMASGISALSDGEEKSRNVSHKRVDLDDLPEEITPPGTPNGSTRGRTQVTSPPRTPRGASQGINTPTETVINQHVRNFEVPATITRRFLDRDSSAATETRNAMPTPAAGRVKNLTLKEQSSLIDKLQKDNWKLKLKLYYLDQMVAERSDEAVKAMISENVDLKTHKFGTAKELRNLKRTIRELEYKVKEREETIATLKSNANERTNKASSGTEDVQELVTEVTFLRERVEEYELEIEKLQNEGLAKDGEKRRLAQVVKSISERKATESDIGVREEVDMWKDLLEAETARKEQADEENRKLREENWRLKAEAASTVSTNPPPNGYPSRRRLPSSSSEVSRANSHRQEPERNGVNTTASSTLVEKLRHENDELRHENAELTREVGAQTSMLTSRNREKERLYQEIEDLKMGQRRGDGGRSVTGDSIFERSASRAHGRSASRASSQSRAAQLTEAERDAYENTNGALRDQVSELKLEIQELTGELTTLLHEIEQYDNLQPEHEQLKLDYENLLQDREKLVEQNTQEMLEMQSERDEALHLHEEIEDRFQRLQAEAQEMVDTLEEENEQRMAHEKGLEAEVAELNQEHNALQNELRMTQEAVGRVEVDAQAKARRIQELEFENEDIAQELESIDKSLIEANGKNEKLSIELESRQGECAFLREEQDGCMLKIGDLENANKALQTSLSSEKDRARELEARLAEERHQHEVIGGKEKQEVQRMTNDLNREIAAAKEESRKLKKIVETREVEARSWKEKLVELETSLREVLGDGGSRSSWIVTISKLQRGLESANAELTQMRNSLSDKERLLQKRDALLESHGLESQKLAELLEKERAGRRNDKIQQEQWQKSHQHTSRTVGQKETRITELEAARSADRKRLVVLEQHYKDSLLERNNLLLTLWTRLAALCGSDWQHQNSLVNQHLPTLEVVSSMLPGFSKNLLLAVKTLEGAISGFKTRIRAVERDFTKEIQALEHNLDIRIKKLDRLESAVQVSKISGVAGAAPEIAKLRGENRVLKGEVTALQSQKHELQVRIARGPSVSYEHTAVATTAASRVPVAAAAAAPPGLLRHHSTSAVETRTTMTSAAGESLSPALDGAEETHGIEPSQQRWIHRLRELERRLKAEREARLLDRNGARKRLEAGRAENEELRMELERERVRAGGMA